MSYRALYRKYRPRLFSDIVGQPGIVQALAGQVAAGRISHAYLFSGPRGTGKTSAAKVLARAINCMDNHDGEACGKCKACVELMSDTNMDVIEIDAASNNSVDKVREMLENVKYMPAVGKYRVYIVDEVHMLSVSAFNALLKTLEEPPAHVVFILATTEPYKLPPTVLSRCQQFQFRRISTAAMTGLLEGVLKAEGAGAEPQALAAIARAADGGMRDALSLLDQCLSLGGGEVTEQGVLEMLGTSDSSFFDSVAACLLAGDAGGAVDLLDRFITGGGEIKTFATDLCRRMRDLFIASYVPDPASVLDVSEDAARRIAALAARYAAGDILKCLGILSELEGSLRYAANPRVLVELALFRCCRTEKSASYEALLARVERLEAALASGSPPARPAQERVAEPAPQPRPVAAPQAVRPRPEPAVKPEPRAAEPAARPAVSALERRAMMSAAPTPPPPSEDDAPWDAEDVPLPPEPAMGPEDDLPDNLPGQVDLFATEAEPPKPVTAQAPAPAPEPAAARKAPALSPGKLWQAVQEKAPPTLKNFIAKGKGTAFDGATLTVTFTEDGKGAVDMLSEQARKTRLMALVEEAAGGPVEIRLEINQWSEEQQRFIERSRAALPKDVAFIIEKE